MVLYIVGLALAMVIGFKFNVSCIVSCLLNPSINEVIADDIIRQVASYELCNHRLKSTDIRWNVLN